MISTVPLLFLSLFFACPDPPPEITAGMSNEDVAEQNKTKRGGPEGDPDSLDLSPGGTMLLDMAQVLPQQSQEELANSETVRISGNLTGTCDGGQLRIDIIEVGGEHSDQGPMIGPLTALMPTETGEYSLVAPKGKNIQVSALCDIDKDGKIVQGTDKLAPGIALSEVNEDQEGVDLVFPGENDTPVDMGNANNGDVKPPGDKTASMPSAAAGERDRAEDGAINTEEASPEQPETEPSAPETEPSAPETEPSAPETVE